MSEECYKKRRDSVFWSPRMLLVCLLSFLFSGTVNAQDKTRVSGNIMDENLQPVIGATITVEGTTLGTSSDARGSFSLEVPASGKLQFSFIGYQTQTVPIERNKTYNIQLLPDATNIDDVVVVGFGTQKKESVIGAIASVQATALSVSSKSALSQTLAGNIPGIIAVQRSGEVGNDRADFWIRGMATFKGNTSPLILVDGVERDFNSIAPKEIESFSILKDASATAVYGVRGANGVIAITTKKGSIGELKVDVSAEYAVKAPTIMPEFVGAVEYMELMNMAHVLGGNAGPEPYPDYRITNTRNRTDPDLYPDVDWMDALVKSTTKHAHVNVNISGGSPKIRYFVSTSYHTEDGIYTTDNSRPWNSNIRLNRVNFRGNFDIDLTKTTVFNFNVGSQLTTVNGPRTSVDDIWRLAITTKPNEFPVRYSDGQLSTPVIGENPYNWLTQLGYKEDGNSVTTATGTLNQKLDFITEGLSARVLFAYDVDNTSSLVGVFSPDKFYATGRDEEGNLIGNYYPGDSPFLNLSKSSAMAYTTYLEASVNYDRTFGKHNVGALVLYNQRIRNIANGSGEFALLPYQSQGLASRVTYNYDNRYFIEGNLGVNGSENFAPGHRIGIFPAVALGWYVSEEPFWENIKQLIPKFKIRGSFGTVGNDQLGSSTRYAYLAEIVGSNGYDFGKYPTSRPYGGLMEGKFGSNLTWETELKRDIGVELSMFGFDLTVDYFNNYRKNILCQNRRLPYSAGFSVDPWTNMGKMKNHGVDMSLVYNYMKGDWRISAMGNFTYARNEIVYNGDPEPRYPNLDRIGHPYGQQFGLVAEGLYTKEDFDAEGNLLQHLPVPELGIEVAPGDIKYRDVNGDGFITKDDFTAIGYSDTPEIVYGLGINVAYKAFDFGIRLQGAAHVTRIINNDDDGPVDKNVIPTVSDANIYKKLANSFWTEENPRQDVFSPRVRGGYNDQNYLNSTWWQRNMSYLRVKDVVVGYTLPRKWSIKAGIEHLRVYFIGNNLLTFSDFDLWDVELGTNSGMKYPVMKSYSFGVELNF